ncbi:hypothetical protein [Brevibacillus reuszeri]|uniref:hypothetical protein n=1 Tax=Brevibacillus reuszeri TaxID=54915 RepID=UPI002899DC73|nr:hypothetical protein [Brevibacillus reuszeri]
MPVPATTGQLKTKILGMEIGDYILCGYDNAVAGGGWNLNDNSIREIPVIGIMSGTPNKWGYFYFVKIGKGLIVADRVICHSISWDNMNYYQVLGRTGWVQGISKKLGDVTGIIRALTGGVAFADVNGNRSTTDTGNGAWPTNNEWDKYVVNFPINLIELGKTLDDIFHWNGMSTWCQDTVIISIGASSIRTCRGYSGANKVHTNGSNTTSTIVGFRPLFEYKEGS